MQTLWSRVATRAACGCPQCTPAVHAVGRRATVSATRRAPKYITSSTLWYSGIFASAATFDAASKKSRSEQWDTAIAGMKEDLGRSEKEQDVTIAGITEDLGRSEMERDVTLEQPNGAAADKPMQALYSKGQLGRLSYPVNTGATPRFEWLPPESVFATEERKEKASARRLTPKKIETIMLSCDKLQLRIWQTLEQQGWTEKALKSIPPDYRELMSQSGGKLERAIESKHDSLYDIWNYNELLNGYAREQNDVFLSNYKEDDMGVHRETRYEMNRSIREVFKQHRGGRLETPALLARVAYNLWISNAPPNIDTYNEMIAGFSNAHPELVYPVLRSIRETHVRPQETTNELVLKFFTRQDQPMRFIHWLELMRGNGNGLALARPDIIINDRGRMRLKRQQKDPNKINQMPMPSPKVFEAVVEGVLKFSGFHQALNICREMGKEGWGLGIKGFGYLLVDCADCGDWQAGSAIWSQLQMLKTRSQQTVLKNLVKSAKFYGDTTSIPREKITLELYAAMLRLCSKCGKREDFEQVWNEALKEHKCEAEFLTKVVRQQLAAKPLRPAQMETGEQEDRLAVAKSVLKHWTLNHHDDPHQASAARDKASNELEGKEAVEESGLASLMRTASLQEEPSKSRRQRKNVTFPEEEFERSESSERRLNHKPEEEFVKRMSFKPEDDTKKHESSERPKSHKPKDAFEKQEFKEWQMSHQNDTAQYSASASAF